MPEKKTILYVDDEKINLMLFQKIMEKSYIVLTAENAQEGLNVLESHPEVNYVISDMRMPGLSGLDFIREVKKVYRDMACYILTGYSINESLQLAVNSGLILDCWTKPADFESIHRALTEASQG